MSTEALKLALDALEGLHRLHCGGLELHELNAIHKNHERAIPVIKQALAAPVQSAKRGEPDHIPDATKMVAAQRQWVGLTDEDMTELDEDGVLFARYIEAKLKEKNTT